MGYLRTLIQLANVELPNVELTNVEFSNAELPNVENYPTSNITERRISQKVEYYRTKMGWKWYQTACSIAVELGRWTFFFVYFKGRNVINC